MMRPLLAALALRMVVGSLLGPALWLSCPPSPALAPDLDLDPNSLDQAGEDSRHMLRALELARQGLGRTAPNPCVGCVIVSDGAVVGEGWHKRAGEAHAEVGALRMAGKRARNATAYVSLEPCNHFGRTAPCTHALVREGVTRVVAGIVDPDPRVSGSGLRYLLRKGVQVTLGVERADCSALNAPFIHRILHGRPLCIAALRIHLSRPSNASHDVLRLASATVDEQWGRSVRSWVRGAQVMAPEADTLILDLRQTSALIEHYASGAAAADPASALPSYVRVMTLQDASTCALLRERILQVRRLYRGKHFPARWLLLCPSDGPTDEALALPTSGSAQSLNVSVLAVALSDEDSSHPLRVMLEAAHIDGCNCALYLGADGDGLARAVRDELVRKVVLLAAPTDSEDEDDGPCLKELVRALMSADAVSLQRTGAEGYEILRFTLWAPPHIDADLTPPPS